MKAIELLNHLKSLPDKLPENTVDQVIYGNPEQEVKKAGTCWMPYSEIISKAHQKDVNVIVAHEPTFYSGQDLNDPKVRDLKAVADKKKLLDKTGITIIRTHDCWDYLPEVGIMPSWAAFLGLDDCIHPDEYIYSVPEQTALQFVRTVALKTAEIGQKTVRFHGDPERKINSVQAWFGWKSPYDIIESKADLVITYDDNTAVNAWTGSELCRDTGFPLLIVNHGVVEEAGMASMADYLTKTFPEFKTIHFKQGCTYKEVISDQ